MAVFSTNQVRQLYVAKNIASGSIVDSISPVGTIAVATDDSKNHMYFSYKGAGGNTRSDLIDIKNIMSVRVSSYKDMQTELKAVTVALDDTYLSEGKPVSGQDYILRIAFRQYVGMSDADQYFKYGMVHAHANMTTSQFYATLALSLAKNFSRETTQLLKFSLATGTGEDTQNVLTVTPSMTIKPSATAEGTYDIDPFTTDYSAVIIDEVEQEWVLGKIEQVPVYFEVQPTTITVDGDEVIWGIVEVADPDEDGGILGNGKKIADLEYFCMGERGDIYRGVGYPNDIKTTYLVDPDKNYNVVDIHYAYVGNNESVQKSEKDITIVIPSTVDATSNLINKIAAVYNGIVYTEDASKDTNLKKA